MILRLKRISVSINLCTGVTVSIVSSDTTMVRRAVCGREYANYYYQSIVNNNSVDVASTNIDLFKSLPSTKCVDFLSSFSRRLIFQSLILRQTMTICFG
jgi:hypothetical protein